MASYATKIKIKKSKLESKVPKTRRSISPRNFSCKCFDSLQNCNKIKYKYSRRFRESLDKIIRIV